MRVRAEVTTEPFAGEGEPPERVTYAAALGSQGGLGHRDTESTAWCSAGTTTRSASPAPGKRSPSPARATTSAAHRQPMAA
ncbi:MAG: hypothetical protein ABI890_19090 [Lapillicoccus sp.]